MTPYLIGVLSWGGLALLLGIAVGKAIARADGQEPCCGSGHPEAGPEDDDLMDVGLAVLNPPTRPLAVVRSTFEAQA